MDIEIDDRLWSTHLQAWLESPVTHVNKDLLRDPRSSIMSHGLMGRIEVKKMRKYHKMHLIIVSDLRRDGLVQHGYVICKYVRYVTRVCVRELAHHPDLSSRFIRSRIACGSLIESHPLTHRPVGCNRRRSE